MWCLFLQCVESGSRVDESLYPHTYDPSMALVCVSVIYGPTCVCVSVIYGPTCVCVSVIYGPMCVNNVMETVSLVAEWDISTQGNCAAYSGETKLS